MTKGYIIEKQGNISDSVFEYNIKKLKAEEEQIICIKAKVNQLNEGYEKNITTIAHAIVSDELYESNIKTIKTKQSDYKLDLSCNVNEEKVLKKRR